MVDLMEAPMSKPCVMPYKSEASTLLVTRLHLIEDQWMTLACLSKKAQVRSLF